MDSKRRLSLVSLYSSARRPLGLIHTDGGVYGSVSVEVCQMTQLVEKALAEIAGLPEAEQDAIAAIILEELASERRWQAAFAGSPDVLATLADEALAEYREGKTQPLDPDAL